MAKKYKKGDIVLVKSVAGDAIPKIHVKLVERIIVEPTKPKRIGFKMSSAWPGYEGWEAEVLYQEEIDILRKEWSIPFEKPGDSTFVYDNCIVKKPRKIKKETGRKENRAGMVTIRRKRKK